jgi:arylsulfatase A-like enzyme
MVGLGEVATVLSRGAQPEEYWLVPYAVVAYGLLGVLAGAGGAVAAGIVGRGRMSSASGVVLGSALAVTALFVIVGRYHVIQRVFHEGLITTSATGIAVHVTLLVAGVMLAWITARLLAGLQVALAAKGTAGLLVLVLAASTLTAVATGPQHKPQVALNRKATAKGPNVILIISDTLRADVLSSYGGEPGLTPAISAFAEEAVQFERAYAQSSWTRPSIASVLTSRYPSGHGAVHKMDPLPDRMLTLAEIFTGAGYWTAGLVSNINVAPIFNFQQGFREYYYLAPDFYFWATDSATRLAIYKGLRQARERLGASRKYFCNYYQDAEVIGQAVARWLDDEPPQPFFLLIHYMDPHDPYFAMPYNGHGIARANLPVPPARLRDEMYDLYLQDVRHFDAHLARLFDRFRAAGLYDDTVIALVSDHGEEFYEHGGWWHGTSLYEEVVHVPLIIKRARESAPGQRRRELVRTIDLAPTLVAAAGLPVPDTFSGSDLFSGTVTDEPLFAEEDLEGNVLASIRIGDWKLITANAGNPRGLLPVELYHLGSDPRETSNRVADEPQRVGVLLEELRRQLARIDAGGPGFPY